MRQLDAHEALFCNKCKDLFCKDVYFCLLLCIMFFFHINILCTVLLKIMLVDLMSKYKTVHKRKEESEEWQFGDLPFLICNVLSVTVRNT